MIHIIPDLIPDSNIWSAKLKGNFNKGRRGTSIKAIVLHATADSNINSSRNWFRNRNSEVSAHYIIDKNGDIYQEVRDENTAYHAGISYWNGIHDINDISIGIEMVNLNDGKDPYPEVQYQSALELVKHLMQKYNITPSGIVTHAQIAPDRKKDPLGFPIDRFTKELCSIDWSIWGSQFPLPIDRQGWAIPKLWSINQWLGAALSEEIYINPELSIQAFQNGFIYYEKVSNTAHIVHTDGKNRT